MYISIHGEKKRQHADKWLSNTVIVQSSKFARKRGVTDQRRKNAKTKTIRTRDGDSGVPPSKYGARIGLIRFLNNDYNRWTENSWVADNVRNFQDNRNTARVNFKIDFRWPKTVLAVGEKKTNPTDRKSSTNTFRYEKFGVNAHADDCETECCT